MVSKRKGGSGKNGGGRRRHAVGDRRTSKEATAEGSNGYGGRTTRKTGNGGGKAGRRCSNTENSKGEPSGRPCIKQQRRRRKRWTGTNKDKKKKTQMSNVGLNRRVQRKKNLKRGNPKRGVSSQRNHVLSSESSGSYSNVPMSSISCGSQPGCSNLSNLPDRDNVSPVEFDHLPWANLNVPMDLSLFQLEINNHGVDFDLQARKNHLRWLANLEKVRRGLSNGDRY